MSTFELQTTLKDIRTQKGLTQQDVADRVSVSRQTIISIEKGNYTPSVLLSLKIAQELEVDVSDLFSLVSLEHK